MRPSSTSFGGLARHGHKSPKQVKREHKYMLQSFPQVGVRYSGEVGNTSFEPKDVFRRGALQR